jgi:hypothetical protein
LKESHDFNKYVKTLRVEMTKRVRKTNKSPEDNQESGRLPRARTRKQEDQKKPARVRKSSRVKEDCQVPRIQKPKSLEDWHHLRVKTQEDDSPISPPTRGGDRERERERKTPLNQPLTHIDFP